MAERRKQVERMFDKGLKHGYEARDKKVARKTAKLDANGDVLMSQAYVAGVESGKQKRNVVLRALMLWDMPEV